MRNPGSQDLIDWIAISLRWLVLMGMAILLTASAPVTLPVRLVLLGAAVWNLALTLLLVFHKNISFQHLLAVGVDVVVAYALFYLSGGLEGRLDWSGLLPVISASLYFQVPGAILVSLANLVVQDLLIISNHPPLTLLLFAGVNAVLYLGTGLLLSIVSRRMTELMTATQKGQVSVQRDTERTEQERRRAIYNLISALSSSLNYQRVLEIALDQSTSTLSTVQPRADQLVSAVLLYTENENKAAKLQAGYARRFTAADLHLSLPGTSGLIGRAIDEAESRHSKELSKDPELSQIFALRTCSSAYCIPLRAGVESWGVLLFAHPDAEFFTGDTREILDIAGNQAVIAIQNARLYEQLEKEKERITEIQEETRKKMARDLHDGPTQSVAAIAMRVNFARHLLDRDLKSTAEELFKIEELARRTTKEIRHMLFTLRPLVLESQGLVAALESMAEKMRETYRQEVIIQADPRLVENLELSKQGVIFYIAEEAINNARKHARASHVWVRLKPLQEGLGLLEIEDDGAGFDQKATDASYNSRDSLGMLNMRERAELLNGVLQVESAEGRGTRVQLFIPFTDEAADLLRRGL